jgi:hypothetical protein
MLPQGIVGVQLPAVVQELLKALRDSALHLKAEIERCYNVIKQKLVHTLVIQGTNTVVEENHCSLHKRYFHLELFARL